jgi:hypothetical protein
MRILVIAELAWAALMGGMYLWIDLTDTSGSPMGLLFPIVMYLPGALVIAVVAVIVAVVMALIRPKTASEASGEGTPTDGPWTCPSCGAFNDFRNEACITCQATRPDRRPSTQG